MMFNGMNFQFGQVNVAISSVDTEKATGYLQIKIPVKGYELEINLKRWNGWSGSTEVNIHFDIHSPKPVSDPQEDDYQDEEDEEESNEEESA